MYDCAAAGVLSWLHKAGVYAAATKTKVAESNWHQFRSMWAVSNFGLKQLRDTEHGRLPMYCNAALLLPQQVLLHQ